MQTVPEQVLISRVRYFTHPRKKHADSSIVPKQIFSFQPAIWMQDQSRLHRSRSSGREFVGCSQLPCGPVFTPNISCTKLKTYLAHADSPIVPIHFFCLVPAIRMQDQSLLHRSRNSEREFAGWNQLPCGPVLTPNIYGWPFVSKLRHGIRGFFCLVYLFIYVTYGL